MEKHEIVVDKNMECNYMIIDFTAINHSEKRPLYLTSKNLILLYSSETGTFFYVNSLNKIIHYVILRNFM